MQKNCLLTKNTYIVNICHSNIKNNTPLQLTIDIQNSITPNNFYIQKNTHIPPLINNRPLEYMRFYYTKYVLHTEESTYTKASLLQLTIDLCNTTTPHMVNIYQNTHILREDVPPPIDHKCMEYHYTKEVSHIAECTYT